MEKYITDECTGLKYELVGDYYLIAGEDESEDCFAAECKIVAVQGRLW